MQSLTENSCIHLLRCMYMSSRKILLKVTSLQSDIHSFVMVWFLQATRDPRRKSEKSTRCNFCKCWNLALNVHLSYFAKFLSFVLNFVLTNNLSRPAAARDQFSPIGNCSFALSKSYFPQFQSLPSCSYFSFLAFISSFFYARP